MNLVRIYKKSLEKAFNYTIVRYIHEDTEEKNTVRNVLLSPVAASVKNTESKVTVVGVGQVGMACVFSILTQGVSSDVVLIDHVKKRLQGEMLDLQHGSVFLNSPRIHASTDYSASANSRLCIVTAGVRQIEGQSRLDLVKANANIFKNIIPQLVNHSPSTTLLIVSNPVDILTYVAWKVSGLPKNRVLGSGTNLDTSRFRFVMSQKLGVAPINCHGWIVGEHGDSSVALWSDVNIAGVRIRDNHPLIGTKNDPENWSEMHHRVIHSANEIIKLKGYTSWAIGLSVASLAHSILNNSHIIHAVSVHVKGHLGLTQDTFLSLPSVLGLNGVTEIVKISLNEQEKALIHKSADALEQIQKDLQL